MKKLVLLIILLTGCTKDDVLNLKQEGYFTLDASFLSSVAGKYELPECSSEEPISIEYTLRDTGGLLWVKSSEVAVNEDNVNIFDPITLPVGDYVVEDIALVSENGNITHRVPNSESIGFDFSVFSDISTPFDAQIFPETETSVSVELMCYSPAELDLSGTFEGNTKVTDLTTLYFLLPEGGCATRCTIVIDGKLTFDEDVTGEEIHGAPIVKEFELLVITAWSGDDELASVEFTEYNPDGTATDEDVVQFDYQCL
ncbi:hypothetical protein [Ulvibacterium marinum]|uniref:Uncharacterized protein n=1 Tax=Ulvibacterium marinum TaxID=2419782 RepID=A0A3B0CF71_9FLAO|nr:hypothetical protein [Ulvibacterium marinum]RKN83334.1 hypothetical protein D7Z94_05785 [Ulvibacterium marinum]